MKPFLAALLAVTFSGCAEIDKIPDDKLAESLHTGAKGAVKYALQAALRKVDPAVAEKIKTDATLARDILADNIIPVFSGAETADVLRSAVDTALGLLRSKITDPRVISAIELAVEIIIAEVDLPRNPAEKLSVRSTKALSGVFSGIEEGIRMVFPKAPAPAPAAREPLTLPK